MHSQRNYFHGWYVWFWILIVSIVSEMLLCPPVLWGLWLADFLNFYQQMFFENLRCLEKFRQYIGAVCFRSVSLGSSFFRRLWPLLGTNHPAPSFLDKDFITNNVLKYCPFSLLWQNKGVIPMICQCGPLNFLALTSSDSEVCCDKTFSCNDFSPTLNTQKAFVGSCKRRKLTETRRIF